MKNIEKIKKNQSLSGKMNLVGPVHHFKEFIYA